MFNYLIFLSDKKTSYNEKIIRNILFKMWVKTSTIFFVLMVIITTISALSVVKNKEPTKSEIQVQNIITVRCQEGYIRVHGKCVPKFN